MEELRAAMGEDDIIALDNGWYKIWIARNYPAYRPNTVLLDNALATMGAGLPAAMMAKMLHPDRRVVCVTGDGGLLMNLGDLETAVRLGLDLTVIVMNNSAYGMIQIKQAMMGLESWGLDFSNPDFVKMAESFGACGYRVDHPDDFAPTLERLIAEPGVNLIDLVFEYPPEVD